MGKVFAAHSSGLVDLRISARGGTTPLTSCFVPSRIHRPLTWLVERSFGPAAAPNGSTADMSYHDDSPLEEDEQTPWQEGDDEGPEPSIVSNGDLHISDEGPSDDAEDGTAITPILPVWLRDQSKGGIFRWVPLPIRRTARWVNDWTKGPPEAQIQRIRPWFPMIQEAPIWLVKRYLPKVWHKVLALSLWLGIWLLTFCLVIRAQWQSGYIEGYGHPELLTCGTRVWGSSRDCGLDGVNCRPFANSTTPFKCGAHCASQLQFSPWVVGTQEIQYTGQVIGGPNEHGDDVYYRGDSFVCQAAIHAGIVSDETGGCGVVELVGPRSDFVASDNNKISSFGFDAEFPKSYRFLTDVSSECGTVDMRWKLLGVTLTFTIIISLFVWEPWLFFSIIFTMLFFHVGMVSDRPGEARSVPHLFSIIIGRYLPGALAVFVLYLAAVKPQLTGLTAQIEKTFLWLGGIWIGALSNYTFDAIIPVSRLTPSDLKRPGAVLAVIIIVLVIFTIALGQVWFLRLEKRLRTYLAIYAAMGTLLIIGVLIPQLNLRIHHYILALLLIPGTRTQTRPALFFQALLLGLYINGIARWNFDSILQTSGELNLPNQVEYSTPNITTLAYATNVTFDWATPPEGYDGVSIVVNDVERYRWYVGEGGPGYTKQREWDEDAEDGEKFYFRFGYLMGSGSPVYTRAGVWERNGTWTKMQEGRTQLRKK